MSEYRKLTDEIFNELECHIQTEENKLFGKVYRGHLFLDNILHYFVIIIYNRYTDNVYRMCPVSSDVKTANYLFTGR